MNPPIIEVTLSDDGHIGILLRTTLLDTNGYGIALASIAFQIGEMMEHEQPNLTQADVTAQIAHFFAVELARRGDEPPSREPTISLRH